MGFAEREGHFATIGNQYVNAFIWSIDKLRLFYTQKCSKKSYI